ncbi:MAG: FeoA domain-containing protein [Anaerolineae bacterium]|nr:FeoA domain-containing protein [Anaerolineae bacterium]
MRTQTTTNESTEMYLKTLAELGACEAPVAVAQIAERLEVSTVSANEMMQRLDAQGLVARQRYKGIELTDDGRAIARSVTRRQRLWECFLADHLGLNWPSVYEFSCRLEHATSNVLAEALANYLDHPETCPHGLPIPQMSGQLEEPEGMPLAQLGIGRIARISAITPTETHIYVYLQERGLLPGTTVKITGIAPLDGPLTLLIDESDTVMLGQNVAQLVLVVPFSAESEPVAPIETTLDRLRPGHTGTIRHVGGNGALRQRYLEMGLTVGAEIKTERVAPLGDPIEYRIKGYRLSLRRKDARNVQITTAS